MSVTLIIASSSVLLQLMIYFSLKKNHPAVFDLVFEGAWFKRDKEHSKRVITFYYFPMKWEGLVWKLKRLLICNFFLCSWLTYEMLFFPTSTSSFISSLFGIQVSP